MHRTMHMAGTLCLLAVLCGCSTMSTITATTPTTRLWMKNRDTTTLPARVSIRGTSFGNYEFKAVDRGQPPLYGILPLKFKGGHLAVDILLFTPAMMFNLRGAFPFYEIDVAHRLIRYKLSRNGSWSVYHPSMAEIARAREFFGDGYGTDAVAGQGAPAAGSASSASPPVPASQTGIISPTDPSRYPRDRTPDSDGNHP